MRLEDASKIANTVGSTRLSKFLPANQAKSSNGNLVLWVELNEKSKNERMSLFEKMVPKKCRGFQAYDIKDVYFES